MTASLLRKQDVSRRSQRWAIRILGLFGWRVRFRDLPGPHGVVIVYPHTSNWDFPVGILAKWAIGMPFRFIAKSSLFDGLTGASLGRLVRYLGGEPVERGMATGSIARLADKINAADWFWLALAPEGTRSYRPHWRSGFYHIALAAKVPLGCAYFDFANKEIALVDYVELSGDVIEDMQKIRSVYAGKQGLRPELAAPVALRRDCDDGSEQH